MGEFQYLDEGNSEAQDRLATSFLLTQSSAGLARAGVLSGLTVAQTTTASGSVLIAAGAVAVQASVGTGVALLVNDTLKTLDVFTANPMGGLPRNDVVAFDSVTKTVAVIVGAPNATPDDPTVPATACALARLRHGAGATTIPTAKIDDLRVATGLAGAIVPVRTQAERNVLQGSAENPAWADCLYDGSLQRNAGAGWVLMAQVPGTWNNLSLVGGWSPWGRAPAVRLSAGRWWYRGAIAGSVTTSAVTFTAAGQVTMVAGYDTDELTLGAPSNGPMCFVTIGLDGTLRIRGASAASAIVTLDGLSHEAA